MKKAFTLIELLVVIAIIAILAAILFPVFAQAKLAAKKTASLSNVKQITLAEIMYQGDNDDMLVIDHNGVILTSQDNTWVFLVQPYIKNLQIYDEPAIADPYNIYGTGPYAWWWNQNLFPFYGYNYMFFSPFNMCNLSLGRSSSSAARPAQTVMFTTAQGFAPPAGNTGSYWDVNAPGAEDQVYAAPNACIWVASFSALGFGLGNWSRNNPANLGHLTSDARFVYPYGGGNIGWLDGHAKFLTDGAAAVGTDYYTASYTSGGSTGNAHGAQITNVNLYLWTLDGTINDLNF